MEKFQSFREAFSAFTCKFHHKVEVSLPLGVLSINLNSLTPGKFLERKWGHHPPACAFVVFLKRVVRCVYF